MFQEFTFIVTVIDFMNHFPLGYDLVTIIICCIVDGGIMLLTIPLAQLYT